MPIVSAFAYVVRHLHNGGYHQILPALHESNERMFKLTCNYGCVNADYTHNKQNAAMMRGLDALGLKSANMPRYAYTAIVKLCSILHPDSDFSQLGAVSADHCLPSFGRKITQHVPDHGDGKKEGALWRRETAARVSGSQSAVSGTANSTPSHLCSTFISS